jgi:hypothetical protein
MPRSVFAGNIRSGGSPRRRAVVLGLTLAAAIFGAWSSGEAVANSPIYEFSQVPTSTQAGGHPDLLTHLRFGTRATQTPVPCECNDPKDLIVQTPPGLVGIPRDLPRCTASEFAAAECPTDSQLGLLEWPNPPDNAEFTAVYNMVPRRGEVALLGGYAPFIGAPLVYTSVSVRSESDYGLEFDTFGIPRLVPPNNFYLLVWGVPADSIHDNLRFPFDAVKRVGCIGEDGDHDPLPEILANEFPVDDCEGWLLKAASNASAPFPVPANSATVPFLEAPTSCSGPLTSTLDTVAFDFGTDHAETEYPAVTGCSLLSFDPSLSAQPTTGEADSASGLDIRLRVPQSLSPTTPSPSEIRGTKVTLPPGFTINPNAADGKVSCSDADARFGTRDEAQCPEFSKIGVLGIESSSLPGVLPGAIYLGKPLPGNRYRVFLTADDFSLHVKLAGKAIPDPQTGQLTISFEDLPQSPFQEFNLHVFGAERGLLATPEQCGTYAVRSEFEPWDNELDSQTSTQFFTVDSGPGGTPCPPPVRPFAPTSSAGVTDNTAGDHTTFALDLTRNDGDQNLDSVDVTLPPGLSGSLAGIPYCSDALLAAVAADGYLGSTENVSPICPASQLGTATATAGAGSRPVSLTGRVYLAGPYGGAPLSLAIVTPAVSGPYDLGNVIVRVPLRVDATTAQVSAASDPLPRIVGGIPLRLRRVVVDLDRPNFILNPTNCSRQAIASLAFGDQGGQSALSSHFQVANCGALDFGPRLGLKFTGGTKRTGHPAIKAILRARPGEANIGRTVVTMPHSLLLDNAHIGTTCTRVQFAAERCPGGSVLGSATAETPLLDEPLKGRVYLRSSSHKLPDLVADLRGQIGQVVLDGRIDSVRARIRTDFESVPDVPVSKFVLRLTGGRKGLLTNTEDLCRATQRAKVLMVGQNGRRAKRLTKLQLPCGSKARHSRHARHRRQHDIGGR